MADKRVKYTYDDGPFSEVAITGKQTSWRKNDSAFVPEADAALLISSGKFVDGTDFGSNNVHKQAHREIGGVPRQVAVSGVPFVIPPGDGAANGLQFTGSAGAFTLSAAIMTHVWNALKGCWVYMPTNFGGSGLSAGWRWAVFSSDTAGVLYQDTYVSGNPTMVTSPTAFATNLTGWITTTTAEITGPTGFVLPGGSMGPNGSLKPYLRTVGNTTANKSFRAYAGATQICVVTPITTLPNSEIMASVRNQGSQSLQNISRNVAIPGVGAAGGSYVAGESTAVDFSVDQTISISLQISTTAACAVLLHADITCTYGA
jgi:hypothetical protein